MRNNTQLGQEGEKIAMDYLIREGYEILHQNYRHKRSEIDLIAKKKGVVVFVEVKMRSSVNFGQPEEAVDEKKEEQIMMVAEAYIEQENWSGPLRFDILSIVKNKSRVEEIRHFVDAFG
jgi:putative endonuclease